MTVALWTKAVELLIHQPLLLLFLVAALGYAVGQWRMAGLQLGISAVLFVGLAVGALHPRLQLPELVYQLGLVLFVYSMGLSSGPGFVGAFRRYGLKQNLLVVVLLLAAGVGLWGLKVVFQLPGTLLAGVFSGSLTNTPALAAVLDQMRHLPVQSVNGLIAEPVIGYSLTYPMGVIGMILAIQLFWRTQVAGGELDRQRPSNPASDLMAVTVRVTRKQVADQPLGEMMDRHRWRVVFGRCQRGGRLEVCTGQTRLMPGDLVSVVGTAPAVADAIDWLGEPSAVHLEQDRSQLDFRRMFVSRSEVVGRPLSELGLTERYGAMVTRIRRGDLDLLATPDMVLMPGDRVRVVAPVSRMGDVERFLGDSYRELSEINVVTLGLGIALGLLLGLVPFPLAGMDFRLGFAAGPLIVGLLLGALGRTGPVTWVLPYSANLTLRQIGLILFLAGVGTRSGYPFAQSLVSGHFALWWVLGALLTLGVAWSALFLGHRVLRIPPGVLLGVVAGMQTQPAVLAFALERVGDEQPNRGYAAVFPMAMLVKILLAQWLLLG